MSTGGYRDLLVWQQATELAVRVYAETRSFPKVELYGLVSQLRRSVVSIPSNIAEGHGRAGSREFQQFLAIARGSLNEVETQLTIAERLGYLKPEVSHELLKSSDEIARMLRGLSNKLSN